MYIVTAMDTNLNGDSSIELYFKDLEIKELLGTIGMLIERGGQTLSFGIDFIPPKED